MSAPFEAARGGVNVELSDDVRVLIAEMAQSISTGVGDDSHPFAARLAPPITVTKDSDDPFLVLIRGDAICTAAQITHATSNATWLEADEAEAWFQTLQVASTTLAATLGVHRAEDLERVDPDSLTMVRILQELLSYLVDALDDPPELPPTGLGT